MDSSDVLPDWRTITAGTRIKVALWLASEVGEGNIFRKQQLREALPGIEQIDRRMRDLRPAGWQIHTYRDRGNLGPDELLLSKIGSPVWEAAHRSSGLRNIPARIRREVMSRDGHRCVRCGVLAGEGYPDDPSTTARLTIGHVNPHKNGSGSTASDLVTECAKCNESVQHFTESRLSVEQVWDRVAALSGKDKRQLLPWIIRGRREPTPLEQSAALVFQLPATERLVIRDRLLDFDGHGPVDFVHH